MSAAPQVQLHPPEIIRSDAVEAIVDTTVRECEQRHANSLRAVVLTGSMARAEESALVEGGVCRFLGDAEFLLIFRRGSLFPKPGERAALEDAIGRRLRRRGVVCPIHLAAVTTRYLRRLPPHIFSYELRTSGKVVSGDKTILAAIPEFPCSAIRREDAWHMLSNRVIEWLEILANTQADRRAFDLRLFYATVKLWMDAATSLLVFLGAYQPSYRARAESLAALAGAPPPAMPLPFPLREFSAWVRSATSWKLMPDEVTAEHMGWTFCHQARRFAGILWCWQAAQLTGLDAASAPLHLLQSSRLKRRHWRGWLRAARTCNRQHGRKPWRHWLTLSRWGSPRQCMYALAAECLLRDGDFDPWAEGNLASRLRTLRLRRILPLPKPTVAAADDTNWRRLVRELAWNYHEFVENTRA